MYHLQGISSISFTVQLESGTVGQ